MKLYKNKDGRTTIYRRDYQKERNNSSGQADLSLISLEDKKLILSLYVDQNLGVGRIKERLSISHEYLSKWKIASLIRHYKNDKTEYYEYTDGVLRRIF